MAINIQTVLQNLKGHITFDEDFHALNTDQQMRLSIEMVRVKYRKTASAPGSQRRMFFYHIQRRKNKLGL